MRVFCKMAWIPIHVWLRQARSRPAFVAFRGTQTFDDWVGDFDALFEAYKYVPSGGQVHIGFQSIYGALHDSVAKGIGAAVAGCDDLLITGHSLGGALAVMAGPDFAKNLTPALVPELITFAGPAAGLADFVRFFDLVIPSCYRVVNFWDLVPRLPPQIPVGLYEQTGTIVNVKGDLRFPWKRTALRNLTFRDC